MVVDGSGGLDNDRSGRSSFVHNRVEAIVVIGSVLDGSDRPISLME